MQGTGSFRLIVRRGPQPNQIYELNKDIITLGRDITNDIVINDPEVSRHHCRLTRGGGGYTMEDLGSTNGTFVNGQRLTGARPLSGGDMIGLGETVTLSYESTIPAAAEPGQAGGPQPTMVGAQSPGYGGAGGYPPQQGGAGGAGQQYAPPPPPPPQYQAYPETTSGGGMGRWFFIGCGCLIIVCCFLFVAAAVYIDSDIAKTADGQPLRCTLPIVQQIYGCTPAPPTK